MIFNKVYSRTYPVYDILPDCTHILDDVDCIITEDSNAGYEMYKAIAEKTHTTCISANGKSNIPGMLIYNDGSRILVIGDNKSYPVFIISKQSENVLEESLTRYLLLGIRDILSEYVEKECAISEV